MENLIVPLVPNSKQHDGRIRSHSVLTSSQLVKNYFLPKRSKSGCISATTACSNGFLMGWGYKVPEAT